MSNVELAPFRVGHWLPSDQTILEHWMETLIKEVEQYKKPLHPVLVEFQALIESDPDIFMDFNQMFTQVPFKLSPLKKPQVQNYHQMLHMMNIIIYRTPEFNWYANKVGLIGFPLNAILDWSMGTPGGFRAFTNDKVNAQLKKILAVWSTFLSSPDSCYVLDDTPNKGWFCPDALKVIAEADPFYGQGNDPTDPKENFSYNFKCNQDEDHWGFTSWDDFFTREFNPGIRPVASPDDDNVIVNACESAPYRVAYGVQRLDTFWIKAQPYSLEFMLNNDPWVEQFVGGTIYQAFLSAKSYHRWHCPVNGTIAKISVVDGTYYSETLAEGFDPAGPNESQGYITEVATRALIFIQADNPAIGLMCVMPVGMAEVSSCDVTVQVGQQVKKGDQLGTFHFGGSTHCLIFGPQVRLAFDLHGQTPGLNSSNIPLNSEIARVCSG